MPINGYNLLSGRQRQIVFLIGAGKTTKEIAMLLGISPETVGNHRKLLCRKLDLHSAVELAIIGARAQLSASQDDALL